MDCLNWPDCETPECLVPPSSNSSRFAKMDSLKADLSNDQFPKNMFSIINL
ncbi:unnamed protein product [Gulo gulo]|uniref:Uncharacterized protein n=1 Tax=Gulo gulo TaxID=48420 RepID=A0A9X9LCB4_GULGU|nr:unnamed protein product [Gulo gulo]